MKKSLAYVIAGIAVVVWFGAQEIGLFDRLTPPPVIEPDWAAIAAWPPIESANVEAAPDPNRQITAIVLDDSGSMRSEIEVAKAAVVGALDMMSETDLVSVVALNKGVVLDFMPVAAAREVLAEKIQSVRSDGSTPLTKAIRDAARMLSEEGAKARAFGTYRIIVTTDGAADAPDQLRREIEALARDTPIQIATIGIAVDGNHVLRRPSIASFVDISNASALGAALTKAVAESQDFGTITQFEGN